jgi:hypothetical protein
MKTKIITYQVQYMSTIHRIEEVIDSVYAFVQDSWDSVLTIIDYYAENQDALIKAAGPGNWNDPDEVWMYCSAFYSFP